MPPLPSSEFVSVLGALSGVVLFFWGIGRAWGRLTGDLDEIKLGQRRTDGKLDSLTRHIAKVEREVGDLKVADAKIDGRVQAIEMRIGPPIECPVVAKLDGEGGRRSGPIKVRAQFAEE